MKKVRLPKSLDGYKYIGNFTDMPLSIGMVYKLDDKNFIPAIHFNDVYPDVDLAGITDHGSQASMKFSRESEVGFDFGGSGSSNLGESEVRISFRKKNAVAGVVTDLQSSTIRYRNIIKQLDELWDDQGFSRFRKDYIFVFQVDTAAACTLIYSMQSNNTVTLAHRAGEPVTNFAALGSGEFEYVSNSKETLEIIRPTACKPLFKAFWFRKNGEPELVG